MTGWAKIWMVGWTNNRMIRIKMRRPEDRGRRSDVRVQKAKVGRLEVDKLGDGAVLEKNDPQISQISAD
jgi:hypothetical protein